MMSPMDHRHRYRFSAALWEYPGEASWHFLTLPEECSDEIKAITDDGPRRGFGSVRVEVTVGPATWSTSIFPSKQTGCFVLPVKKDVRTRAGLAPGDDVAVDLALHLGT
jgi:hypothetical protein